jgi:uncharacterized protein (TIGR04376 family)
MGLFDDLSRFLETRLEEFLRSHPQLELQALEEQLREQEQDTQRLILDLQRQEKQLQDEILAIAQDIQVWHKRVTKAKQANRPDLLKAAQEREASLLSLGNQRWGQMEGVKKRTVQAKELLRQIQVRRQEVQAKAAEARKARASQTSPDWETNAWNQARTSSYQPYIGTKADPLDQKFRDWETEQELEEMKRNLRQ